MKSIHEILDNSARKYPNKSAIVFDDFILSFDELLKNHDNLFIFGEDVGKIGDVNQGLEGLQKKYGLISP